jgi:hypothetical protein
MLLSGCWAPAYQGEPACGDPKLLHAQTGATCSAPIRVACDCQERATLHCVDGRWAYAYDGCARVSVAP